MTRPAPDPKRKGSLAAMTAGLGVAIATVEKKLATRAETAEMLAKIKPPHGQMDGSGKYSPNLYRWTGRWLQRFAGQEQFPQVFRAKNGELFIGRMAPDADGWFSGARLWRVLCNGARQECYAWRPKDTEGFKPVTNFWGAYIRIGRCAIDKDHDRYQDDERWTVKGKARTCNWCGKHKQRLRVKTLTKRIVVKKWVKA